MAGTPEPFTANEQRLMSLAWQCFEGDPKINFDKLAGLAGMTNVGSARNAWARIRNKLNAYVETTAATANTPTTPLSRKRKAGVNGKQSAPGYDETPTKKSKGKKYTSRPTAEESDDEEDTNEMVKVENEYHVKKEQRADSSWDNFGL